MNNKNQDYGWKCLGIAFEVDEKVRKTTTKNMQLPYLQV